MQFYPLVCIVTQCLPRQARPFGVYLFACKLCFSLETGEFCLETTNVSDIRSKPELMWEAMLNVTKLEKKGKHFVQKTPSAVFRWDCNGKKLKGNSSICRLYQTALSYCLFTRYVAFNYVQTCFHFNNYNAHTHLLLYNTNQCIQCNLFFSCMRCILLHTHGKEFTTISRPFTRLRLIYIANMRCSKRWMCYLQTACVV